MININQLKKEIDVDKQSFIKLMRDLNNFNSGQLKVLDRERNKAKFQTLQEVCKEIQVAFNKCSSCMLDIVKEKPRDNNTQRDWEQRIDELILLYSSISGLNYNEAKEELLNKLKSDEK